MKNTKLALFAYNFPHRKTQDFLLRLFALGFQVELVLAADWVQLNIPPASIRTKVRHGALLHPELIAQAVGAEYLVCPHDSEQIIPAVQERDISLAVIAGARILPKNIIDAFEVGVINFHPGLIPEARGLDAMLWSIYHDLPLGVTAHLIDQRVDAGLILDRHVLPIQKDDTIFDLSERMYEVQLDMLPTAIQNALQNKVNEIPQASEYHRKMPAELEAEVLERLPAYIHKHTAAG